MPPPHYYPVLLLPLLVLAAVAGVSAGDGGGGGGGGEGEEGLVERTYIVRVDADAKPSVYPTHAHWYESAVLAAAGDGAGWPEGGQLIHTYSAAFHGFSARMSPTAAEALASVPGVAAVVPERVRQLATTRSPRFLGLLSSPPSALLADSDFGPDLVIVRRRRARRGDASLRRRTQARHTQSKHSGGDDRRLKKKLTSGVYT